MLTRIVRSHFVKRSRQAMSTHDDVEDTQMAVLRRLLMSGRHTEWGRAHNLAEVNAYGDYRQAMEVTPYETLRPYIMRMVSGERDILWPG